MNLNTLHVTELNKFTALVTLQSFENELQIVGDRFVQKHLFNYIELDIGKKKKKKRRVLVHVLLIKSVTWILNGLKR